MATYTTPKVTIDLEEYKELLLIKKNQESKITNEDISLLINAAAPLFRGDTHSANDNFRRILEYDNLRVKYAETMFTGSSIIEKFIFKVEKVS